MSEPALLSAQGLLALYASGALSPVEALQSVLERVARHNPRINAFAVLDPGALIAAGQSEARWRAGRPIGPLDGVPCTVKDLLDVVGLPTRRGSLTTNATPASADAPAVAAMRRAGAVILGKTTTTEFGWKTPGDCPLHGITRNPWDTTRTPGGSSAGAAAAAAACFGPLHIGTDAGGSIRIPAAWCGLFGLKPSFGRVPQWPLGAFANVAVAGPITRTAGDCALLLSAIARYDPSDPYSLPDDPRDWTKGLGQGVAGLRIGVLAQPGFDALVDPAGIRAVERAAVILADAGASLETVAPDLPDVRDIFGQVWGVALARLVDAMPPEAQARLDSGLLDVARQHRGMRATEYLAAEGLRLRAAHAMATLHQDYDLILSPTVPGPPMLAAAPTTDPVRALWTEWAPWTFLYNLTRQPALTVPLPGDGLPASVQFAAALYRDDLVLRAGQVIETSTGPVVAPL